jgi:uncharacterized protein (TIGR02466 family)
MDLFPTRIYQHQTIFEEYKEIMTEAEYLLKKVSSKGFTKHPGWEQGTHSLSDPTFNENALRKYRCYKIMEKLNWCVQQYVQQLGHTPDTVSSFDIESSWVTHTAPNEYARLHHHGTSDMSGVFFIKGNANNSGNLYFQNSNAVHSATRLYSSMSEQHDIPVAVGSFVLFPGWLPHGTRINTGDEDRVSVSFNIKLN